MLVKTFGSAVFGIDATTITIEVNVANGVNFVLVGLPDKSVQESHQRIKAALKNNEPRVNVQSINIVDSGEGRWLVTVSYRTTYNQTNPLNADQIVTIEV